MFVTSMNENGRSTLALFFPHYEIFLKRQFSVLSRFHKLLSNLLYKKYKGNSVSNVCLSYLYVLIINSSALNSTESLFRNQCLPDFKIISDSLWDIG
jgi:hypothetical protein